MSSVNPVIAQIPAPPSLPPIGKDVPVVADPAKSVVSTEVPVATQTPVPTTTTPTTTTPDGKVIPQVPVGQFPGYGAPSYGSGYGYPTNQYSSIPTIIPTVPGMYGAPIVGTMGTTGAGTVGTLGEAPAGVASAQLGAAGINPPSTIKTVLKNVALFGALGAGLGAAASFILPGGPLIGGAIGGGIGAIVGAIRGLSKAKKDQAEFQAMMTQQLAPQPTAEQGAMSVPVSAARKAKAKAAKSRKLHYTVKRGDTLSAIAKKHNTDWHKVYEQNKAKIGSNPNSIKVGLTLSFVPGS